MSDPDKPYTYEKIHEDLENIIRRLLHLGYTEFDYHEVSMSSRKDESVSLTVYSNDNEKSIRLRYNIYSLDEYRRIVEYVTAKYKAQQNEQPNKD